MPKLGNPVDGVEALEKARCNRLELAARNTGLAKAWDIEEGDIKARTSQFLKILSTDLISVEYAE